MTTATKITLFRVVMIPVFLVCMYLSEIWSWMQIVSCVVFAVASLSDILDGQIARRCNQVTDLGKFLDPLADKVLVIAAMGARSATANQRYCRSIRKSARGAACARATARWRRSPARSRSRS